MSARVPAYLSDRSSGRGALPARSALATDAPRIDLAGEWAFRLHPTAAVPEDDTFPDPSLDDSSWDRIAVPSHWVMDPDARFGRPAYNNVIYPFPVEPPMPPDENPTGEYRRTVEVPEGFAGGGRVLLRFDGVESVYRVWWNGVDIGIGKGSRLAHEFDVTDHVVAGTNVVAVRVHQWSDATYLEDQDQWWAPGIFRDVTLLSRPAGSVRDVWLRTSWRDGVGGLDPEVAADASAYPLRLSIPELGVDVEWATPSDVAPLDLPGVEPWSAESPQLYAATVANAAETLSFRLGFRTVEIVGDRILANGRRLVFNGVNRHEWHPDRGRVFNEADARADLSLMKRFNVNSIRTSHYPPHPQLLDLADELGLWVMLECDYETHGFEPTDPAWNVISRAGVPGSVQVPEAHNRPPMGPWTDNPSDDVAWRSALLDRVERTVERDKNHASVVMWSLGNEAGTGANLAAMAAWIHDRDPSRAVHYEGDYRGSYADVYSRMYATVPEVISIGSDETAPILGCSIAESVRQRAKPFLLAEYAHAMGNGPGGLAQYADAFATSERLHGGFIWEWRDHGVRTRAESGEEFFGYGGDFGEVVHDGDFVMDGLILSDGTPTPGLHEFAAVIAPFTFTFSADGVRITNRRHSRAADDVEFAWVAEVNGRQVVSGVLAVGDLAAGESTVVALGALPAEVTDGSGEGAVTVEARLRSAHAWAPDGHVVARGQLLFPRTPVRPATTVATPGQVDANGELALGPARFHGTTLVSLGGLEMAGPELDLFRAPTSNDLRASAGSYDLVDPEVSWTGVIAPSAADMWTLAGLNRLGSRLLESSHGPEGVHEVRRWATASAREYVLTDLTWTPDGDGVRLRVEILPSAGWAMVWPRIGIRFALPLHLQQAEWFGLGPEEAYPDSMVAAHLGRWSRPIDDLVVDYAVPQESGHRPGLRELTLSGPQGGLHVETLADGRGRRPGFSVRRHTAQEVSEASHSYKLPTPTRTWLTIDAAQHGLGSRACGPDVWPDAVLRPEARTISLRLSSTR